ncbi:MAG: 50S ribosomal protein L21 [Alphaproteobacteria bacterium]|nr:50S ribosomal protein L21 [Rickettsiales bacterium]
MLVIAESGGKQYSLEVGKVVEVDFLHKNQGDGVVFDKVLLCLDGDKVVKTGSVSIVGKVIKNGKRKKVIAFKKQRRTSCFEKRKGFRAMYTQVLIEKVDIK